MVLYTIIIQWRYTHHSSGEKREWLIAWWGWEWLYHWKKSVLLCFWCDLVNRKQLMLLGPSDLGAFFFSFSYFLWSWKTFIWLGIWKIMVFQTKEGFVHQRLWRNCTEQRIRIRMGFRYIKQIWFPWCNTKPIPGEGKE